MLHCGGYNESLGITSSYLSLLYCNGQANVQLLQQRHMSTIAPGETVSSDYNHNLPRSILVQVHYYMVCDRAFNFDLTHVSRIQDATENRLVSQFGVLGVCANAKQEVLCWSLGKTPNQRDCLSQAKIIADRITSLDYACPTHWLTDLCCSV